MYTCLSTILTFQTNGADKRGKDRKRNSVPILGMCIEICEETRGQICRQIIDNLSKEEGHAVSKHFVSHTGGRMTKDDEEIERSAASIDPQAC